ncbi:MAG: baseplate J/gp47 family protein [Brevinema sp.]
MKSKNELVNDIIKETAKAIPQISNYNTGGVFRLFVEVVASFIASIYEVLDSLKPQRFIQTAGGEYLDLKAEELGLSRRTAIKTRGYVLMSRKSTSDNIRVPAGKIVSSKQDSQGNICRFVVLEEQILEEGTSTISVLVEAEAEGSAFNLSSDKIVEISTPISGIDSVRNTSGWIVTAGTDAETDESLRLRCLAMWRGLSGANKDAYISWAKSVEGIENVKVFPLSRGAGSVDVVCTAVGNSIPSEDLLDEVLAVIEKKRPLGADIRVRAPFELVLNTSVEAVFLPNYEASKQIIEDVVDKYFRSLGIGADFEPSALTSQIMQVDGIKSVRISSPETTRISDLQIARLGTLTVTVSSASEA